MELIININLIFCTNRFISKNTFLMYIEVFPVAAHCRSLKVYVYKKIEKTGA